MKRFNTVEDDEINESVRVLMDCKDLAEIVESEEDNDTDCS